MGSDSQEYWSGQPAIPCSRGSSWPKNWTWVSCMAGRFFTTEPPGKLQNSMNYAYSPEGGPGNPLLYYWVSWWLSGPWGHWESDTTEWPHFHFSLSCIGEGNGNPLQCSCLENPRDGGAWWAAVYGVAQSWTRLKRLSSSSNSSRRRGGIERDCFMVIELILGVMKVLWNYWWWLCNILDMLKPLNFILTPWVFHEF